MSLTLSFNTLKNLFLKYWPELGFVLIAVIINTLLFTFKNYFSFRDLFLLPDIQSYVARNGILEFLNYQFLKMGVKSEVFYSMFIQILFNSAVIGTYITFTLITRLMRRIKIKNKEDEPVMDTRTRLLEKAILFIFALIAVYNPISLKYFLVGSLVEVFTIYTLPLFYYLVFQWFSDINRIFVFVEDQLNLPSNLPILISSLQKTFILSVAIFAYSTLNLSLTFIILLLCIVILCFFFSLLFDFRKEVFYKPSIYIEDRKKYIIVLSNVVIKYILYPLIILAPTSLIIFLINKQPLDSNRLIYFLPDREKTKFVLSLGTDWLNLSKENFPELGVISDKLGWLSNFTAIFNPYILLGITLVLLCLILFWVVNIFQLKGKAVYLNLILFSLLIFYFATYLISQNTGLNEYLSLNNDHISIHLFVVVLIICLLSLIQNLLVSAKNRLLPAALVGATLFIIFLSNLLPFAILNQAVNYYSTSSVYSKINSLCSQNAKIVYLPTNNYIKNVYYQENLGLANPSYKDIPVQNPAKHLSSCRLWESNSADMDANIYVISNIRPDKERLQNLLKELKDSGIELLIIENYNNPTLKQFNGTMSQIRPPLISENNITVYQI